MAQLSPDGSQIAYVNSRLNEVRLMRPKGEDAHKLIGAAPSSGFLNIAWSPNGKRLACLRVDGSDLRNSTIEVRDLLGGAPIDVVTEPLITSLAWASDGRLLYARGEAPPKQESYGLWELAVDEATGRASGTARCLATWLSQSVGSISVSRDGSRVMLTRGRTRGNVLVGQLGDGNGVLSNVRQLTRDDRVNWPSGWTPDGEAVLFHSDRNGDFDLFKQARGDREPQPLLLGPDEVRSARVSPDRRWILYLKLATANPTSKSTRVQVMRMPVGGGPPEQVFETTGNWGRGEGAAEVDGDFNWAFPEFRCAAAARPAPCLISEAGGPGHTVLSAFDPVGGRKGEVARLDAAPEWLAWDLSPDATRVAWTVFGYLDFVEQPVRVLSLSDGSTREIPLGHWLNPNGVAWSADGRDVFVTTIRVRGGTLLTADAAGRVRVLVDQLGKGLYLADPRPSPDGRSLAYAQVTTGSNAWVLEAQRK